MSSAKVAYFRLENREMSEDLIFCGRKILCLPDSLILMSNENAMI